jgi:hypothetical protein
MKAPDKWVLAGCEMREAGTGWWGAASVRATRLTGGPSAVAVGEIGH